MDPSNRFWKPPARFWGLQWLIYIYAQLRATNTKNQRHEKSPARVPYLTDLETQVQGVKDSLYKQSPRQPRVYHTPDPLWGENSPRTSLWIQALSHMKAISEWPKSELWLRRSHKWLSWAWGDHLERRTGSSAPFLPQVLTTSSQSGTCA